MSLKNYLRSLPDDEAREQFAAACGTSLGYLGNCIYTAKRTPGPAICADIERATSGAVRRWDLRPHDWHRIWPELIGQPGAPAIPQQAAA